MRRIDLIRRALTTWDYFGPISYSKILWAKSYEPSRAKRSPVTKCDQKTPYRRKSAKSHFRAKITKLTDFHRKRDPSELGLLNRTEVQNGSSRAQLFKNPIFVAGRNFWRQQMLPQGQIQSKPWLILSKSVTPEISTGNKNLIFGKLRVRRCILHHRTSP